MKKHNQVLVLFATAFISLLLALPQAMAATETGHGDSEVDTIDWFRGDVEQAFAMAKEKNKPLFLYWGAIWCPYCARIKNTVFKSRDFIALSELFVPFYLDGDTDQAQAVGERFGVKGYPTMIVLTSDGREVTRIPGGIDIDQYNSVLRRSLNSLQPTSELLALAMSDPDKLTAEDFTQLAYYSWGQDNSVLPEGTDASLFKNLSDSARARDEVASSRLYMQFLEASSGENSEENPVRLRGADQRLVEILNSDELVLANWGSLAYSPEIMNILDVDEPRDQALRKLWQDRLMALRHDPSLSAVEQLGGWRPLLVFHFEETDEPLPVDLAKMLDEDIAAADAAVTDRYARQGLVHQIKWTYQYAHMNEKARQVLLAELDRSASPYYFMSGLGSLAEEDGNKEEALEWYRKAWEASAGSATRLQWGASYVRALIRLAPDEKALITSTADALFEELASSDDVFNGRNFRVLKRLNDQMVAWQSEEGNRDSAQRFFSRIQSLCKDEPEQSVERQNCESLVSPVTG